MTGTDGNFVWFELMTNDVTAAKKFYGDVVGWTAKDTSIGSMRYETFFTGETPAAGLMTVPEEAAGRCIARRRIFRASAALPSCRIRPA